MRPEFETPVEAQIIGESSEDAAALILSCTRAELSFVRFGEDRRRGFRG